MNTEEKDVIVNCECEEDLLDTWLRNSTVERFLNKAAKHLARVFPGTGRKQALADMLADRVYRFIVPPFLAFVALGFREMDASEDLWVDLDQFVGSRKVSEKEALEEQVRALRPGAKLRFFHSSVEVPDDLPLGKTTTITLNPTLPSDVDPVGDIPSFRISVMKCYERDAALLSFHLRGDHFGRFSVDKACVSLALSMKQTLNTLEKQLRVPVIQALQHTKDRVKSFTESLEGIRSVPIFTLPEPSILREEPLVGLEKSLRSDLEDLQQLAKSLSAAQQPRPSRPVGSGDRHRLSASPFLTLEFGGHVCFVNPTQLTFPSLALQLVTEEGEVLRTFDVQDIKPNSKEVVFSETQVQNLLDLGGVALQLGSAFTLQLV